MKLKNIFLLLAGVLLIISLSECRRETWAKDPFSFTFSEDTLLFDTVFTRLGGGNPPSAYEVLVVKNTLPQKIKTNIKLAGGSNSPFRMNVDGRTGTEISNYEVEAGDSFYIFVEAFPDQTNTNNPLVITDSLMFENNGQLQNVKLVCWGQDAHYLSDTVLSGNVTLKNDGKPWVMYNFVGVDYNAKLTIEAGNHIYCHSNTRLYIGGTLQVLGDTNNRVVFEGDRLTFDYREVPNQWFGIRMLPRSHDNIIQNCLIKNAVIGIEVDSLPTIGKYNLMLKQTEIRNMGQVGVVGFSASILAENCLIFNCGKYSFAGIYGGNYDVSHCTFAIYNGKYINRNAAHFGFNNEVPRDANNTPILQTALTYTLQNNIIYGDQEEEFEVGLDASNPFPVTELAERNLMRTAKLINRYKDKNLVNQDPKFGDPAAMNYIPENSSPAIDYGNSLGVMNDLRGAKRINVPDAGCYEVK